MTISLETVLIAFVIALVCWAFCSVGLGAMLVAGAALVAWGGPVAVVATCFFLGGGGPGFPWIPPWRR